jgi:inosine-uridine nucleoside N-ribohydrolase
LALSIFNISYCNASGVTSNEKVPLIIDTDSGWDDWVSLVYLIKHEKSSNYRIIGVISNGIGEARLKPGVKNIRNILALADRADIPVYEGSSVTLKYSNRFPDKFRDSVDSLLQLAIPNSKAPKTKIDGQIFLKNTLSNSKTKVDILALGGLTDIAKLIKSNPKLSRKINNLFIMGGSFDLLNKAEQQPIGNVQDLQPSSSPSNMTAEFNMFLDPKANQIVMRGVKSIIMVPLNACKDVELSKPFIESLPLRAPVDKFVHTLLENRLAQATRAGYKEYFYDPLTAVVASGRRDVAKFEIHPVSVESKLNSKLDTSGTTYINKNGKPITIAVNANMSRFLYYFRQ